MTRKYEADSNGITRLLQMESWEQLMYHIGNLCLYLSKVEKWQKWVCITMISISIGYAAMDSENQLGNIQQILLQYNKY